MRKIRADAINRIIDANLNRLKEGLRVCEEITRFILESRPLTQALKRLRHKIDASAEAIRAEGALFFSRNSKTDIGRRIYLKKEFSRRDYRDIFFANFQRAKESLRVLEEFLKLKDMKLALKFKQLRYEAYAMEKKAAKKFSALRHY